MELSNSHPTEPVIVCRGGEAEEVPASNWAKEVLAAHDGLTQRFDFLSADHHAVRRFVVRELVRTGRPVTAEVIADHTDLEADRVSDVLAELEKGLFFLVRNDGGDVAWAFPVTTDQTPHRLTFSTGERLFGA